MNVPTNRDLNAAAILRALFTQQAIERRVA